MKVVALISGGKDSCYAMMKCIHYGHEIVALGNLMPDDDSVDELDSYMYQTVGHQIIVSYAECMGLPLFRRRIKGSTRHQKLDYKTTPGDEVEDLFTLLSEVKRQIPAVMAVSSGAIASDYQRLRVESVCSRLGLVSLAYLWKQDQSLLLQEMIADSIMAITVKVAAMGLYPKKHLGKEIAFLNSYLHKLKEMYGINVCGEGGEYETLTLDCPLFTSARIMLDEYQIVMHSSDPIAPVGILHPLAFHLEKKAEDTTSQFHDKKPEHFEGKLGFVYEVQGDTPEKSEVSSKLVTSMTNLVDGVKSKLNVSRTKNRSTFSMCCWIEDSHSDLQEDLKAVLGKIELQLVELGFGWENVLYIHLYIDDMDQFTVANRTYVQFITKEKCPLGVPSRSTIELPLLQVGLGRAYVEVLVSNEQTKRVLHVQSISCWAPSCIGPYSQATLHKNILHMAGQLGLDPPTMNLCKGGPTVELEQALKNSEAVAQSYNCSIATSAIAFVIYCSINISASDKLLIQDKQCAFLKQLRLTHMEEGSTSKALDPIFLYVVVPGLPKGAALEIKPILYVNEDTGAATKTVHEVPFVKMPNRWGFKHVAWHESCVHKCVIPGKVCAILLSIPSEVAAKISSDPLDANQSIDNQNSQMESHMGKILRFCLYRIGKVMIENAFEWEEIISLRFYVPTSNQVPLETLSLLLEDAFSELAQMNQAFIVGNEPMFNLVPVLGGGCLATSTEDIITCELLALKS